MSHYVSIRWLVFYAFAVGCVAFLSGGWMVKENHSRAVETTLASQNDALAAANAELASVRDSLATERADLIACYQSKPDTMWVPVVVFP